MENIDIYGNVNELFEINNNHRKMQGKPMMRRVHLLKIRNRRIAEWDRAMKNVEIAFARLGHAAESLTCTTREFIEAVNKQYVMGFDLDEIKEKLGVDIPDRFLYGQKLINQNAVVKIVTSGEKENGDEPIN